MLVPEQLKYYYVGWVKKTYSFQCHKGQLVAVDVEADTNFDVK